MKHETQVNFILYQLSVILLTLLLSCKPGDGPKESGTIPEPYADGSFGYDYEFLKKYTDIILLESGNGRVAVSPALQGRVMTSAADGMMGTSYGWINRAHFESGDTLDHINVYGGEERFWLGPEGGQYSIFFKEGVDFTFENWSTPRLIDLEPFDVRQQTGQEVSFTKTARLTNYSGFTFDFEISRSVTILSGQEIGVTLNIEIPEGINAVGYKTANQLKNVGSQAWDREKGLLSIWLLGMMRHSPTTTVIIPYIQGEESQLGVVVNDDYFGKVPEDRLVTSEKAIFFKADGQQRGKIGLSPDRAQNVLGSYDPASKALTIVKYNKPDGEAEYVNSKWELQDYPYNGDVINAYNDGPAEPGAKPMGPFYEMESSSPAAALSPQESIEHIQYTFHFEGVEAKLDLIAQSVFNVSLVEIKSAFNPQ